MSRWTVGVLLLLLAQWTAVRTNAETGWRTYRSDKFGYEISYPPDMEFKASIDGGSADLKDAKTGASLLEFEVWPVDECPRQPAGVSAKGLGVELAKTMTQTDGDDSSSSCGDPMTSREFTSATGQNIFELTLTCERERFEASDDDTVGGKAVRTREGTKGPTYFVDISPSWKARILLADPVGVDPRMFRVKQKLTAAVVRKILKTVKTLPTEKPDVVCIEELQQRAFTIGRPAAPTSTP
nr:hypothetical protein Hi04_10k_c1000_00018 [uncultured bacterium]